MTEMRDGYEILSGGWALPPVKSFLPGTVIRHTDDRTKSETRFIATKDEANIREANRASRKRRVCSEVEKGAAWAAFIPIVIAGLEVWVALGNKGTTNIIEVWHSVSDTLTLLAVCAAALFIISKISSALELRYEKEIERNLKTRFYWRQVEDTESLFPLDNFPELKGLAKTESELETMNKIEKLESIMNPSLEKKERELDGASPISDEDYSQ